MKLGQERASESGRYAFAKPAILRIVISPRAGTGLRHAVDTNSDDLRAIDCGIDVDGWYLELKPFDATTIGCVRCKAAARRRDNQAEPRGNKEPKP